MCNFFFTLYHIYILNAKVNIIMPMSEDMMTSLPVVISIIAKRAFCPTSGISYQSDLHDNYTGKVPAIKTQYTESSIHRMV